MRRQLIIVLLALAGISNIRTYAQVKYEPFIGVTIPLCNAEGNRGLGPMFGLNVMKDIDNTQFRLGLQGALAVAARDIDAIDDTWSLRTVNISVLCEYLYKKTIIGSPFLGLGVGVAQQAETMPGFTQYLDFSGTSPILSLYCGTRIGNHFKMGLDLRITNTKEFNTLGLSIGYAF